MRIVAWNIRAGGGERIARISRHLERWAPDAVVLSEFRATPPSLELARSLVSLGLAHQCTSASRRNPSANALLVAARWPVSRLRLRAQPREPGRWLLASVDAPRPLLLGAMHVPNRVTGRKYMFLDSVLACARRWSLGPALFVGDTNSGRRGIDEEGPAFRAREAASESPSSCGAGGPRAYWAPVSTSRTSFVNAPTVNGFWSRGPSFGASIAPSSLR